MGCAWNAMIRVRPAMRLIWITVLHALVWFIRFCLMGSVRRVVRILCMGIIPRKNVKLVLVLARRVRIQRRVLLVFNQELWISYWGVLVWHHARWTRLCWSTRLVWIAAQIVKLVLIRSVRVVRVTLGCCWQVIRSSVLLRVRLGCMCRMGLRVWLVIRIVRLVQGVFWIVHRVRVRWCWVRRILAIRLVKVMSIQIV